MTDRFGSLLNKRLGANTDIGRAGGKGLGQPRHLDLPMGALRTPGDLQLGLSKAWARPWLTSKAPVSDGRAMHSELAGSGKGGWRPHHALPTP